MQGSAPISIRVHAVTVSHVYLSTACLHKRHNYCASQVGTQGDKRPARCKFCDARCICPCHADKPASLR